MFNNRRRSPLKSAPLRQAGQSLEEELQRLDEEQSDILTFLSILLCGVAWEIFHYCGFQPPLSIIIGVAAVCGIYFVRRLLLIRRRMKNYKLGKQGEVVVGQMLDALPNTEYRVLHDMIAEGFNVDHIVICAKGIYAIDTKTRSKPEDGLGEIYYDGRSLRINGYHDRKMVSLVQMEADWVRDLIKNLTGREIPTRGVLLFPEWYVKQSGNPDVWVLNAKAFRGFLDHVDAKLMPDEISLIYSRLAEYQRSLAVLGQQ